MDFDLTDEQQATIDVAAKLLGDKATPDAVRAVEHADDLRFDRELWAAMADAGLLGIAVPAEHGGAGLGLLELALVLEEVGRRTAPVPALAALALGGLPVVRWGSAAQQAAILPGLVAGTTLVTAALVEPLGGVHHPTTTARRDGGGWVLDGTRTNVPASLMADRVIVMYLGRPIEQGPRAAIFAQPLHPYTRALQASSPSTDPSKRSKRRMIKGELPSPIDPPPGWAFHPRCPYASELCARQAPPLFTLGNGHQTACFHRDQVTRTQAVWQGAAT